MSVKVKFLLAFLVLGLVLVGAGWVGMIRFGLDATVSAVMMQIGALFLNLAWLVGIISIIGFKRLIKWMYFIFVITFVICVLVLVPFVDFLTMTVLGILCLVFTLTLIPIFKNHK